MSWELIGGTSDCQKAFYTVINWLEHSHELKPTKIAYETKENSQLTITYNPITNHALITGHKKVHFFRGLGLLVEMQRSGITKKVEEIQFDELNFLLDASRNAVMTVDSIKQFIIILALMGYTGFYLYIEDTYEINDRPYFGYMRGRFSKKELQEIDCYALLFGIEMVPCIQTLAHLEQVLKWETMNEMKDDKNTLLVGSEATYHFILEMLESIKDSFHSEKIHIGLDEAYGVGLGQYLNTHDYTDRYTLIKAHLNKVVEMCREIEMKPLVWSDFIYHTLDKKSLSGYYPVNAEIDFYKAATMPKDITYVYWDYGEFEPTNYKQRLINHRLFADDIMFAGGIHIYGSLTPNHGKSLKTLNPALMTCKEMGVKKIMATTWGDNGQETSHWNALPIMQWYAEHTYNKFVTEEFVATRFASCVHPNLYDQMIATRYLDEVPGVELMNHYMANPSKYLLWQDPLLGLFDAHVEQYQKDRDLVAHYEKIRTSFSSSLNTSKNILHLNLLFYEYLATVLQVKSTFGIELIEAYKNNQRTKLTELAHSRLPLIIKAVEDLRDCHQTIWMTTYKPFGWEVLDNRYGGLLQRLKTTRQKIETYLSGEMNRIEELEEKRLPFLSGTTPLSIHVPDYTTIVFSGYH
ncbi:MAG: beta-N-acetylhexosaminidase [Carnobacterium sp.]|uniref:beta-N-acetylhexosaminidase n=1 Tax=Carnobacterium sp. TaxID=48221 RepID=UPI003C70DAE0